MRNFYCPQCGGRHFGRYAVLDDAGDLVIGEPHCHDEHAIGCRWRGPWHTATNDPAKLLAAVAKLSAALRWYRTQVYYCFDFGNSHSRRTSERRLIDDAIACRNATDKAGLALKEAAALISEPEPLNADAVADALLTKYREQNAEGGAH